MTKDKLVAEMDRAVETIGYVNAPSMFAGYLDKSQGGARKENLDSFTPLINHVVDYNMWAVKPDSKFRTVKDVLDEAKKRLAHLEANGPSHFAFTFKNLFEPDEEAIAAVDWGGFEPCPA